MTYVLEHENEFERLERQSHSSAYNYIDELKGVHFSRRGKILDAGCGSGIVTRYLAECFPEATIKGCDASPDRVREAEQASKHLKNASYSSQNISNLTFNSNYFDNIVCRFVFEHLGEGTREKVMSELIRCLKPKGTLCVIDIDGLLFNLFPQTPYVSKTLEILQKVLPVDLFMGRKLPHILEKSGLTKLSWRIETVQFQSDLLLEEMEIINQRFMQTRPILTTLLGSEKKVDRFFEEYLSCLKEKGTVLFYNKFIVTGRKANHLVSVSKE
jgi:cyclopropane fatty-acyl-phospholipid synthase-like methyltransferase